MSKTIHDQEPYYFDKTSRLSEGITYVAMSKTLFWVDIFNALIHKITNLDDVSTHSSWHASADNYMGTYPYDNTYAERIGVVFPVDKAEGVDEVYFGAKYGLAKMSYATQTWEYVIPYSDCGLQRNWADLRSNDGNVSPEGDVYVGFMHDFHAQENREDPQGALVKMNIPDRTCEVVIDHVLIPNALNWNSELDHVYFTDSLNFIIWKIPYHNGTIRAQEKSVFLNVKNYNKTFRSPEPDGAFIDPHTTDLFTAVWSTNSVQRYNSQGKLVHIWTFPHTDRISCCTLANGDMFVTSANTNISSTVPPIGLGGAIWRVPHVSPYTGSSKRNPLTAKP